MLHPHDLLIGLCRKNKLSWILTMWRRTSLTSLSRTWSSPVAYLPSFLVTPTLLGRRTWASLTKLTRKLLPSMSPKRRRSSKMFRRLRKKLLLSSPSQLQKRLTLQKRRTVWLSTRRMLRKKSPRRSLSRRMLLPKRPNLKAQPRLSLPYRNRTLCFS